MGLEQPGVAQFESTAVAMVKIAMKKKKCGNVKICGCVVVTAGVETTDRG